MQTLVAILLAMSIAAAWRYFKARNHSEGRDQRTLSQTAGFFIVMVLVILLPIKSLIADSNMRDIVMLLIGAGSTAAFKLAEIKLNNTQKPT